MRNTKACTLWAPEPERLQAREKCADYKKFHCFGLSLRYKEGVQICFRYMNGVSFWKKNNILKGKGMNHRAEPPHIQLYRVSTTGTERFYPQPAVKQLVHSGDSRIWRRRFRMFRSGALTTLDTPPPSTLSIKVVKKWPALTSIFPIFEMKWIW